MPRGGGNVGACSDCIVDLFVEARRQPDDAGIVVVDDGGCRFAMHGRFKQREECRAAKGNAGGTLFVGG